MDQKKADLDVFMDFIMPDPHIREALKILINYGQIDGAHHKMWIIDQAIRELVGENYDQLISLYCEEGEYSWDEGIAP